MLSSPISGADSIGFAGAATCGAATCGAATCAAQAVSPNSFASGPFSPRKKSIWVCESLVRFGVSGSGSHASLYHPQPLLVVNHPLGTLPRNGARSLTLNSSAGRIFACVSSPVQDWFIPSGLIERTAAVNPSRIACVTSPSRPCISIISAIGISGAEILIASAALSHPSRIVRIHTSETVFT